MTGAAAAIEAGGEKKKQKKRKRKCQEEPRPPAAAVQKHNVRVARNRKYGASTHVHKARSGREVCCVLKSMCLYFGPHCPLQTAIFMLLALASCHRWTHGTGGHMAISAVLSPSKCE